MAKDQELSFSQMLEELASKLQKQAQEPDINGYVPHAKQIAFHKSKSHLKLYIGGNRSGKTYGGISEDVWFMQGKHPYRELPWSTPTRGRIVSTDYKHGIEQVIIPQLKRAIPPSLMINGSWSDSYSASRSEVRLANGSTIDLMTYEQDTDKFAGTSRHWTHFDEEPPKEIYEECMMRLVDTGGYAWITMTPVEGMTWIYDAIYLAGVNGDDPEITVIEVDISENPHIDPVAMERVLKGMDKETRDARERGTFVQVGGKVYKNFDKMKHVIAPVATGHFKDWAKYMSMDHGYNNPTAWLFHAVSPYNEVVTFAEHYEREMTVAEHAAVVKQMMTDFKWHGAIIIGDPAIVQRTGVTGTSIQAEYARCGISIGLGNNNVLTGVNQVSSYLNVNPRTLKPHWQITENCTNLIREIQRLHWKQPASKKLQSTTNVREEIHKHDDHACDSARYFFSAIPQLAPAEIDYATHERYKVAKGLRGTSHRSYDEALVMVERDRLAGKLHVDETEWTALNPLEW